MQIYLDIPSRTVDRAMRALEIAGYRSLSELMLVALENQVSVELSNPGTESQSPAPSNSRTRAVAAESSSTGSTPATSAQEVIKACSTILTADDAALRLVRDHGWLSGFVNRLLPIKVAARALLRLQESASVTLDDLREVAANDAADLARKLIGRGADSVSRDESILIGLPAREPLFRSKRRFADHFVGRVAGDGSLHGALFELGLAAVEGGRVKRVGLTKAGCDLASLANPVMDRNASVHVLSEEEIEVYLRAVVLEIPRERDCFSALLNKLAVNAQAVADLDELAERVLPVNFTRDVARSQKTSALGRLRDLGLISRERSSHGVYFHATEEGRAFVRRLTIDEAETSALKASSTRDRR